MHPTNNNPGGPLFLIMGELTKRVENTYFYLPPYNIRMLTKRFLQVHKVNIAIVIFILIFGVIHWTKPSLMYNSDGGFRPFGVGYAHKTVIPMWIVAIILAILAYLAVLFFIAYF